MDNFRRTSYAASGCGDDALNQAQARQRAIGRQLRGLFDDIVEEGIPGEIDALLEQLEQAETDQQPDSDVNSLTASRVRESQ